MGIQYLWVDALCIIQDDLNEKDWYEQSGKVRQIYSHCHPTIAADDSQNVQTAFGILAKRMEKNQHSESQTICPILQVRSR
jgi:hypothetical protein